jgi:hypothetical protein
MKLSFTPSKKRCGILILAAFLLSSFGAYADISPNVTTLCTSQTYTTGTTITQWSVDVGGIVSFDNGISSGSTISLTAIGNGTVTLTATIQAPGYPVYDVYTKVIHVGGPISAFTIEPLWYTENRSFCTNSMGNNFHVISGDIPDITSFEWGLSPATVLEADGWLQYSGMIFSSAGHYQVYCRAKNACGYGSSATQTYDLDATDCVGGFSARSIGNATPLAENSSKGFIVYPNPVKGLLTITVPPGLNLKKTYVRIIDFSGRPVKYVTGFNKYQTQVNIASLVPGNYILEISDNGKRYTKKIIKQ